MAVVSLFPPSLPSCRASPVLPGSSTQELVLQVSRNPFGAGTPPPTLLFHPSLVSQSSPAHVASEILSPGKEFKGLIVVWDSLLLVLISPFNPCVPVATGSPCECLVIPTDTVRHMVLF